jgi:hypothetical protein
MYWDLYDGIIRATSDDSDTLTVPFNRIWGAMKRVDSSNPTVVDFYNEIISGGDVSVSEWDANFSSVSLDQASLALTP